MRSLVREEQPLYDKGELSVMNINDGLEAFSLSKVSQCMWLFVIVYVCMPEPLSRQNPSQVWMNVVVCV